MELLLWRWSTTAQIASALMIAVFFVVLSRSMRRIELRPWVGAWLANLGALGATSAFWFYEPAGNAELVAIRSAYFFFKTLAVVLLTIGAWGFFHPRRTRPAAWAALTGGIFAYALLAGLTMVTVALIGVVQSGLIAIVLTIGGVLAIRRGAGWLAAGFLFRSLLGALEALAYGSRIDPAPGAASTKISIFLASHSSFDTGAEWVIALGCVLTLYRVIQRELTQSNQELLAAQQELQALVDRDSLTGLANRRVLAERLRESFPGGATILFFDLNDFKQINDSYGHPIGDECLKRFAGALQATFGEEDHLFRYGGDEFVVIAHGQAGERVDRLRDRLEQERVSPRIRFAAGEAYLPPDGDGEAALREADEAMYGEKRSRRQRRLRPA